MALPNDRYQCLWCGKAAIMKKLFQVIAAVLLILGLGYVAFSLFGKHQAPGGIPASSAGDRSKRHQGDGDDINAARNTRSPTARTTVKQGSESPASLDLEEAKRRLSRYRSEVTDVIDHAEYAAALVVELCENGRTQDAWDFIERSSGQMRNMQLREFFKNANLTRTELMAWLSGLEYDYDLKMGLEGYMLRLRPSEYVAELASPEISALRDSLGMSSSEALRKAMKSHIDDLYHRKDSPLHPPSEAVVKELLDSIAQMDAGGLIKMDELQEMVMFSPLSAFTKWDLLKRHADSPEGLGEGVKRNLIQGMIFNDPQKAMGEILSASGAGQSGHVDVAIRAWMGADSGGLMEWYSGNVAHLGSQQQAYVVSAFANTALSASDFDNARKWAAQIQDPETKAKLNQVIADKEAGLLRAKPKK